MRLLVFVEFLLVTSLYIIRHFVEDFNFTEAALYLIVMKLVWISGIVAKIYNRV